jgi:hypothetical protein
MLFDIIDGEVTEDLLKKNFYWFGDWIKSIERGGCLEHDFSLVE